MAARAGSYVDPSHRAPKRRPTDRAALPVLCLAGAVGLYCGVDNSREAGQATTASIRSAVTVACDSTALKTALTAANAATGPQTITLTGGCTYSYSTPDNYYYGPNALPPIANNITIDGTSNGATIMRASGGSNMRLFYVAGAPTPSSMIAQGALTLTHVTLSGGIAQGGNGAGAGGGGMGAGGAIFAQGNLTLSGVTMTGNEAQGGSGGAGGGPGGGGGGMGGNGTTGGGGGGMGPNTATLNGADFMGGEGGKAAANGGTGGGTSVTGGADGTSGTVLLGGTGGGSLGLGSGGGGGIGGAGGDGGGGGGDTAGGGGGGAGFGGKGGDGYILVTGFGGGGGGFGGGGGAGAGGGGGGVGGGGADGLGALGGGGGGGGFGGGGGQNGNGGFGGGGGGGGTSIAAGGNGGSGASGGGGGGAGLGGAIFMQQGTLLISNSTLFANQALGGTAGLNGGGGLGVGGGIFTLNATVTLVNSTIAGNTGGSGLGGAIYALTFGSGAPSSSVIIKNTILSGSVDSSGGAAGDLAFNQMDGMLVADISTKNLVQSTVSTSGTPTVTGTITPTNPMLAASLANNTGPTQTLAPQTGSPAIDAGDDTTCQGAPVSGIDQRGATRPSGPHCDIGAVEYQIDGTACSIDNFCGTDFCRNGVCCNSTCATAANPCQACTRMLTGGTDGTCGTISVNPTNTVCRAAVSSCDIQETCDGTSTACPTDAVMPAGTDCAADIYVCEKGGVCDGKTTTCGGPALYTTADHHLCRAATKGNDCSMDSYCDGSGPGCHVVWRPATTPCNKVVGGQPSCGQCNASGVCLAPFTTGMCH